MEFYHKKKQFLNAQGLFIYKNVEKIAIRGHETIL